MKIHVFHEDKLSRRVFDLTEPHLAAKSVENDPQMALQNDPKTTKNRCQKMIKILIDFKIAGSVFLKRPGGMRWPPGGIIGGARNTLFDIFERLGILMNEDSAVSAFDPARPAPPLRGGRRI